MSPVVRFLAALSLALAALCVSPLAAAVDSGDIVVVRAAGEVQLTVSGVARAVRAGNVLELPATLRTGRDGSVELRQGTTTVSIGPETLLEFPAPEKRGAPIDRIMQPRGNAFYNIGKREGRKLRVETPYLVGVIKGTQFNVAAFDESTTISLFEGLLEVRATDESDVVDLKAGEIASRKRGDKSISVLKMDAGKAPTTAPRPSSGSGSNDGTSSPPPRAQPANDSGESMLVDRAGDAGTAVSQVVETARGANVPAANGVDLGVTAVGNVANAASVNLNSALAASPAGVEVAADTRVDAGTEVNLGSAGADVSAAASISAGPVAVDTVAAVSIGATGVDVATGTSVDAGPLAIDTSAAVNLDASGAGVNTTAAVDAGPIAVDATGSAAVDVATATVDTAASASIDAGVLTTDVGATSAVDAAAGTVDLGLTLAGANLDLGVDLGLDSADSTPDTGNSTTTATPDTGNTVVDVGGLLDGLLRRPGRK